MKRNRSAFEGILDEYFESFLEDNPIAAATSGLRSAEGKLGQAGAAFQKRQSRRRRAAIQKLEEISPQELDREQQLDRLAFRSLLQREEEERDRGRLEMDPNGLDRLLHIILHELQRGEDEPARAAANIRSLLRQAPRFLEQCGELLQNPEPVWRNILAEMFAGTESFFGAVTEFLGRTGSEHGDSGLVESARRAALIYHDGAMEKKPARSGSFAIGAEKLARRVRDDLGLDYSLAEIESLAKAEVERVNQRLKNACARLGKRGRPDEIIARFRAEWQPRGPLLELYRKETARLAAAFRETDAVSFPAGDTLEVRPVPEFMRPLFPVAAYSAPGAFEKRQRGIFWVNDLSPTKKTEAAQRAERAQHFGLSLTCAHEAYPGHHLQFTTANRHPRKWRRLFAHAIFYEGWTLWCEQMMVDLKVDRSPWLELQQLHDALWRCHRILVDLRLQTGRYRYPDAVRHLQKHLGFTQARAEADVNWYTGSPGIPMSYWLGRLENERLKTRLMDGRGWSLRRFNDWLLHFGTLPQGWIEKYGLD